MSGQQLELTAVKSAWIDRARAVYVGNRFGKLTALRPCGKNRFGHRSFECRCDCGNEIAASISDLFRGHKKSCGCARAEANKARLTTHGKTKTRAFKTWLHMKERCLNKNCKQWKHYGGRGIKICSKWENSFEAFFADMGDRPKNLTIERIDNNGDYRPGNCRWATQKEQNQNYRRCLFFTINDETLNLKQWSNRLGINYLSLYKKINGGMSFHDAIKKI